MIFPSLFRFRVSRSLASVASIFVLAGACSVAESKNSLASNSAPTTANAAAPKGATIEITQGGPADTVRAFYKLLREKKFRDAIFLTNLRPAIEGLTDTELKEFAVDFEAIAGLVPETIEINGEIISEDNATVTANLPNPETGKNELQQIKLRRENGVWVILSVEGDDEKKIKADGKQYFYNLRIQTRENEARDMMTSIAKAQFAWSSTHGGQFGDVQELISGGFLPEEIKAGPLNGYNYSIEVLKDKKRYSASATPAEYGKSGKLSFAITPDGKRQEKDNGGKPLQK